ncbi:MAG: hypothetical protein HON04_03335, partial [Planctomicrobium sp.]|nr:hypothetical protein [Planctomicrobium sp.]
IKGKTHHTSDGPKASNFLFNYDIRTSFGRFTDATSDIFFVKSDGPASCILGDRRTAGGAGHRSEFRALSQPAPAKDYRSRFELSWRSESSRVRTAGRTVL